MKRIITRLTGIYLNVLSVFFPRQAGKTGFRIFCNPFAPPVTQKHLEFLNTSEKYTMDFNGIPVQIYRWGTGPLKIVFLHGWQSHSFRWKKYIEAFSKEAYTLYALDAPAHGLSGGKYFHLPMYEQVIEKFLATITPVHAIVTHSFGGFAILYAFHRNPALAVDRLVLTGIPGEASEFVKTYRTMLHLSDRTMKAVRDHWILEVHHPPEYYSGVRFAADVTVPGLIIHDKNDKVTPYAAAVAIHEAWRGSKLITTIDLGHNLKSMDVVNQVVDFVTANNNETTVH